MEGLFRFLLICLVLLAGAGSGFCLWMFVAHTRDRFSKQREGSLAVARYVYGIIWHTAIVRLGGNLFFLALGISALQSKQTHAGGEFVWVGICILVLTISLVASLLDNPRIRDSNEQIQKDYEADVREAVRQILVRPGGKT
jgi:hypothetical protein